MRRAPVLWLACAAVATTLGCGRANTAGVPRPVETPRASAAPGEHPYRAVLADIESTILINGELRAAVSRELNVPNIRSGFASTVTYLAPEGGQVKQGDRILEFDASTLLGQKSEAQRKLDEAKLKIEKTRADLDAIEKEWQDWIKVQKADPPIGMRTVAPPGGGARPPSPEKRP